MAVKTIMKREPVVGGFVVIKIKNMEEKEIREGEGAEAEAEAEEEITPKEVEEALKEDEGVDPKSI